ncbi:MAG TPA: twin-arginine translocation signal domain-containing protein, partial [Isosphaeraceae bacterium]|nr:twin-arginine translocation signal domain-containing protein [Isosphaeraceae bacterium]
MKREEESSRRQFLAQCGALGLATAALPASQAKAATTPLSGKAEACIFLWLGGGAAQIDTL